jgi:uncharacterized protein (DUF1697 family)
VRHIVLLRGVNLGPTNRVSMPELRGLLEQAGFADVQTYVQSGNVVLTSRLAPQTVGKRCAAAIAEALGLELELVVRTREELAAVVRRNPLRDVATDPKRYQVSFLDREPPAELVRSLEALVAPPERFFAQGRELYAWHPRGVARSKLWAKLASRSLGPTATARNWTTVTRLLELASG